MLDVNIRKKDRLLWCWLVNDRLISYRANGNAAEYTDCRMDSASSHWNNRPRHGSVTLPPPVLRVEFTSWRGKVVATLERASFFSPPLASDGIASSRDYKSRRLNPFRRKETDGSKATVDSTDRKREASRKGYRPQPRAAGYAEMDLCPGKAQKISIWNFYFIVASEAWHANFCTAAKNLRVLSIVAVGSR